MGGTRSGLNVRDAVQVAQPRPQGQPAADSLPVAHEEKTMAERHVPDREATERASADRSPVTLLLLVPVVLVLWPPLFNSPNPSLFGIPFFYWYQLAVIPVGVLCTALVYRATTRRGGRS